MKFPWNSSLWFLLFQFHLVSDGPTDAILGMHLLVHVICNLKRLLKRRSGDGGGASPKMCPKKRHQAFHKLPFCNGGWIMLNQILLICKFQMVDQFESCDKHWAGFWCQAIESRSGLMTLSRHAMVGVAQFVHQDWKPVVKEGVNDTFELCFTFISKKS